MFQQRLINDGEEELQNAVLSKFEHQVDVFVASRQADDILDALVHRVLRSPKNLVAHLQRIYFCYQAGKNEQLYGAIVDFLIILAGKGRSIAQRVIYGCRLHIDSAELLSLSEYLRSGDVSCLLRCRYSVFNMEWLGELALVEVYEQQGQAEHDFLDLASDYIEYSQLDEAIDILETGMSVKPERVDIQRMLLELYKSTRNKVRFEAMHKTLLELNAPLVGEWQELAFFFNEASV